MVIYADILLAVNWWIDFLLLLGVRRAAGQQARGWRLALGALVGGVSALALLLPPLPVFMSFGIKLAAAVGMVLTAFPWPGWRRFWRLLGLLFFLSAGLAGLCGALYFFVAPAGLYVSNGVIYYGVPPLLLVGLTVLCYGILWAGQRLLRLRAPRGFSFRVEITRSGRTASLRCLYDSGNHLTDPFSGRPVLIAERRALTALLPPGLTAGALPPEPGWRVIPYASLGGDGMLPAFLPQGMRVHTSCGVVEVSECYIAVCENLGRGEYQGLIGSALGDRLVS